MVGGNRSALREEPLQAKGDDANVTQKDLQSTSGVKPGAFCFEATMLTTGPTTLPE